MFAALLTRQSSGADLIVAKVDNVDDADTGLGQTSETDLIDADTVPGHKSETDLNEVDTATMDPFPYTFTEFLFGGGAIFLFSLAILGFARWSLEWFSRSSFTLFLLTMVFTICTRLGWTEEATGYWWILSTTVVFSIATGCLLPKNNLLFVMCTGSVGGSFAGFKLVSLIIVLFGWY